MYRIKSINKSSSVIEISNNLKTISVPFDKLEISPFHGEDLGTYVHEFTEASIIQIFRRWRKDWNRGVQFEGYNDTYIVHFISVWGANNGACLEPATRKHKPKW